MHHHTPNNQLNSKSHYGGCYCYYFKQMSSTLETPGSKSTCKSKQFYGIYLMALLLAEITDQRKRDEQVRSHLLLELCKNW